MSGKKVVSLTMRKLRPLMRDIPEDDPSLPNAIRHLMSTMRKTVSGDVGTSSQEATALDEKAKALAITTAALRLSYRRHPSAGDRQALVLRAAFMSVEMAMAVLETLGTGRKRR